MQVVNAPHLPVRPGWLALRQEAPIDPDVPVVDAHHHLWDRHGSRYLAHELLDDTGAGHRVEATVYVQCRSMLRQDGPAAMRPVGEVEFANGVAAMGASGIYGPTRLCDAIVGGADLTLGDAVAPVLEAMMAVSGGRLRGIRNPVAWHEDPAVRSSPAQPPRGLMREPAFQRGAAMLARYGLSLDVWAYHSQLDELYDLARAVPDVAVVIDHFGGPVGVGPYAGRQAHMLREWRDGMARLAMLPNTHVKLGGAGMPVFGFGFAQEETPPASGQLAAAWRPYFDICVELFGAHRCMFESNFPVDKGMFGYVVLWNAFKRLAAVCSADERADLLAGTARRIYRLLRPL
jgi:predicted TIM-barrel fold metal-dependent hydrolase